MCVLHIQGGDTFSIRSFYVDNEKNVLCYAPHLCRGEPSRDFVESCCLHTIPFTAVSVKPIEGSLCVNVTRDESRS